mmetsp:Transcript_26291/g.73799  ORF Transcript_26291/g.73799 Transcript_26291/m.73799 type:complete len:241 (-) Transcript_26291:3702-4424(-)
MQLHLEGDSPPGTLGQLHLLVGDHHPTRQMGHEDATPGSAPLACKPEFQCKDRDPLEAEVVGSGLHCARVPLVKGKEPVAGDVDVPVVCPEEREEHAVLELHHHAVVFLQPKELGRGARRGHREGFVLEHAVAELPARQAQVAGGGCLCRGYKREGGHVQVEGMGFIELLDQYWGARWRLGQVCWLPSWRLRTSADPNSSRDRRDTVCPEEGNVYTTVPIQNNLKAVGARPEAAPGYGDV